MNYVLCGSVLSGARGFLGWSRTDLAKRVKVDRRSLDRLEDESRVEVNFALAEKIRKLLEEEGLEFLPGVEGHGPGVRWKSEEHRLKFRELNKS